VTATAKPTIWIVFNLSPLCRPQRIMVAWTAPNNSKAPVPAERETYANEKPAAYTKSAAAETQLPYRSDEIRAEPEPSRTGAALVPTVTVVRTLAMSQSATAPERIRTRVKVAGSRLLCFNAARHRSELLAKAIIASSVRMKIRAVFKNFQFRIGPPGARHCAPFSLPPSAKDTLLFDPFPEPAMVRNIWKDKLALVEGERAGAVAAAER